MKLTVDRVCALIGPAASTLSSSFMIQFLATDAIFSLIIIPSAINKTLIEFFLCYNSFVLGNMFSTKSSRAMKRELLTYGKNPCGKDPFYDLQETIQSVIQQYVEYDQVRIIRDFEQLGRERHRRQLLKC